MEATALDHIVCATPDVDATAAEVAVAEGPDPRLIVRIEGPGGSLDLA